MDKELTVYITTCDSNMFILKYFQYFFNKYWGTHMKVKILGFNKPNFALAENIEFVSLGSEQVGGAKGWSNYIIDYFNSINDDFFVFGIDDFIVARPVGEEVYKICNSLLNSKIGRIDLQCSMQHGREKRHVKPYIIKENISFLQLKQSGFGENIYQNSGAFSIWNKKYFLKNIRRDWSPWDWEIKGSKLAEFDGYKIIGSMDKWALRKLELISNAGWPGVINTTGIRVEDIEEMKKLVESTDRVKIFENVSDKRWGYYDSCGEDWVKIIFGD